MPRTNAKTVFLLAIPLVGLVVVAVAVLVRSRDWGSVNRERQELEEYIKAQRSSPPREPAGLLTELRSVQQAALGGNVSGNVDPRAAKTELLRLGPRAIPSIKKAIYDAGEPALFRMELIALLADMKDPGAQGLLVEILLDRSLEERFRAVALAKLTGARSDAVFAALRKVYEEERDLELRHLLLRAIGESGHREATGLLIQASGAERTASARIQAIDSLGQRTSEPGVFDAIRGVLRRDSGENVRLAAIGALAKSSDPSVDAFLEDLARNPEMSAVLQKAAARWVEERRRR
ncbi:MAG: HEAT repeat domain-containing protein [Planctomycetota bacterium]